MIEQKTPRVPKIKICGLTRDTDIQTANEICADYVGFVFAPSRRRVSFAQAESLRKILAPGITPVGVFVDEPIENILALLQNGVIDMVQLHGTETGAYIKTLKAQTSAPLIKAIAVREEGFAQAPDSVAHAGAADFLLLDKEGGGTGQTFDWNLVKFGQAHMTKPFFLAGGLTPENVAQGVALTKPYAVDVSSGVEFSDQPGVKSPAKIRAFVQAVRGQNG